MTIHINLDDPAQVDALFDACLRIRAERRYAEAKGSNPDKYIQAHIDHLMNELRQNRSPEDIRRDNAEATREYQNERQYGWGVR